MPPARINNKLFGDQHFGCRGCPYRAQCDALPPEREVLCERTDAEAGIAPVIAYRPQHDSWLTRMHADIPFREYHWETELEA